MRTGDRIILGRIDPGDGDLDPALAKVEILRQGLAGYSHVRKPRQVVMRDVLTSTMPQNRKPLIVDHSRRVRGIPKRRSVSLILPTKSPSPTYQVMLTFCPGVHTVVAFGDKMCGT